MPGRTYALGFLRSYADYLGFDGDDLIAQIRSTVADLTDKTRLHGRTPLSESRPAQDCRSWCVSLAALAGIYAGWAYVDERSQAEIEPVAEVPDDLRQQGRCAAARERSAPATAGRDAASRPRSRRPPRPPRRRRRLHASAAGARCRRRAIRRRAGDDARRRAAAATAGPSPRSGRAAARAGAAGA